MKFLKSMSVAWVALLAISGGANGVEKAIIPLPLDASNVRITGARLEKSSEACGNSTYGCGYGYGNGLSSASMTLVVTVQFDSRTFYPAQCGEEANSAQSANCHRTGTYTVTGAAKVSSELAEQLVARHQDPMTLVLGHQLEVRPVAGVDDRFAGGNNLELVVDVRAN